ncbi:MAG: hypothetical protein RL323_1150 [Pseudomonadota bacterium]|jgi:hypothetical protein
MIRRKLLAIWVAACCWGSGAWAALPATQSPWSAPPTTQLRYHVSGKTNGIPYRAQAALQWDIDSTRYQAHMEFKVFLLGSRHQRSQGTVGTSGLQPLRFEDESRRLRAVVFDPQQLTAQHLPEGTSETIPKAIQDRLSVFMQLAGWLNAAPQLPELGQRWHVPVMGLNGFETWTFVYRQDAPVDTSSGPMPSRLLEREARHPDDQRIELWLAPQLRHLPARIRIRHPNGDVADQVLTRP